VTPVIFAKRVFQVAGVWGLFILSVAYAAHYLGNEEWAVVTSHPQYVHGFFLVTLAWQVAFLIIATDPVRYRLLMLAAMLEKFPFTLATILLYAADAAPVAALVVALIDGVLGVLFAAAYIMTDGRSSDE
jgi:hypothetical protein